MQPLKCLSYVAIMCGIFDINFGIKDTSLSDHLIDCFRDFTNLIPAKEFEIILKHHKATDVPFISALRYLVSSKFQIKVNMLMREPEFIQLLSNLEQSLNTDLHVFLSNTSKTLQDQPDLGEQLTMNENMDLGQFLEEVKAIMPPYEELKKVWREKKKNCHHFRMLIKAIKKEFATGQIDKVLLTCGFRGILDDFRDMHVPIDNILVNTYKLFGHTLTLNTTTLVRCP